MKTWNQKVARFIIDVVMPMLKRKELEFTMVDGELCLKAGPKFKRYEEAQRNHAVVRIEQTAKLIRMTK